MHVRRRGSGCSRAPPARRPFRSIGFIADAAKFFWFFILTLLALLSFTSLGALRCRLRCEEMGCAARCCV